MLRLEKRSYKADLNIVVRPKERLWNRSLLYAFAIAVAWHLFILLTFTVKLDFSIPNSQTSKIWVQSFFSPSAAETDNFNKKKLAFLTPPEPVPDLPHLGLKTDAKPLHKQLDALNPFWQIEEDRILLDTEIPDTTIPGLQINLIGSLSERGLIKTPSVNPKVNIHFTALYEVRIEDPSGKIFWHKLINQISKENELYAENILKNMQFEPREKAFVTSGNIEITL